MFEGNSDYDSYQINILEDSPMAKSLRLYPVDYHKDPALRMEIYGCSEAGNICNRLSIIYKDDWCHEFR